MKINDTMEIEFDLPEADRNGDCLPGMFPVIRACTREFHEMEVADWEHHLGEFNLYDLVMECISKSTADGKEIAIEWLREIADNIENGENPGAAATEALPPKHTVAG